MAQKIDSDALAVVTKSLGLTGRGSQLTEFLDGQLDQTFDVLPAIRRGRTLASTEGIFTAILRNIHSAANSVTTTVRPYNIDSVDAIAPWPAPVPEQFDIWLLEATVSREAGAGDMVGGLLDIQLDSQGFGRDSAGAAVVGSAAIPLAFWDALATEGAVTMGILAGARGPIKRIGIRLPRINDPALTFRTTSDAAAEFQADLILGLFPVSLGQDGLV